MAKNTAKTQNKKKNKEPISPSKKLTKRFWMLINYLTIILISAIIFGFSAYCEYMVFQFIWGLLAEDIQNSEIMENLADFTRIAIFVVTIMGMIIHSGFSIYGQFQIEKGLANGDQ